MSKGKKAKAEVQHSPLPWRMYNDAEAEDANGNIVLFSTIHWYDEVTSRDVEQEEADMQFVLKAVNDHERLSSENRKLHEIACALTRSRDAALKEADKLRELVREMVDKLDDAWDFINRIDTKAEEVCDGLHSAMEKARSAIGEEVPE